jgi:hypothetical protein
MEPTAFVRSLHALACAPLLGGRPILFALPERYLDSLRQSPLLADIMLGNGSGRDGGLAFASASEEEDMDVDAVANIRMLVLPDCAPLYPWLLPKCAGAIHHGGAYATQVCLSFGVPCVAFPAFGDQYFWADRLAATGAGALVAASVSGGSPSRVLHYRMLSAPAQGEAAGAQAGASALEQAIGACLSEAAAERAAAVARQLRSSGDGLKLAVLEVRDILSKPQHRHCGVTCDWQPDSSRRDCSVCSAPFTLTQRRSHCRSCGRLACRKCLGQRCHLPGFPEDAPQLTCESCLDHRRAFFAMKMGLSVVPELGAAAGGAGNDATGTGGYVMA